MKIIGNKNNLSIMENVSNGGKLSHAYLFVGPKHSGKSLFGHLFAGQLLCEETTAPCGKCFNCRLFEAGNHPDFLVYDSEEAIGVDEIRELIHFLDLKPYQSKLKVALITHFERLSTQAANSFLKTLEEPAENTILLLTAENMNNLLPTIISRSQVVRFQAVKKEEIAEELANNMNFDKGIIEDAVRLSGKRIGLAIDFCEHPEKIIEAKDFLEKAEKILAEKSYAEKILFAENLSKEKTDFHKSLDLLEVFYKERLMISEPLKFCRILDKIAKSKDCLYRNGNIRLIAESLMLLEN